MLPPILEYQKWSIVRAKFLNVLLSFCLILCNLVFKVLRLTLKLLKCLKRTEAVLTSKGRLYPRLPVELKLVNESVMQPCVAKTLEAHYLWK